MDNDCNAATADTTTWYHDVDGDAYGAGAGVTACTQPVTYVDNDDDCDDTDEYANPEALEVENGIDDDCDTYVDAADSDLVCMIEIDINTGSTVAIAEINGAVSSDATLDGEWYSAGVDGVTVTSTSDGSGELYIVEFEHCLAADSVITLDVVYADGAHGCNWGSATARGAVSAWQDVTSLDVGNGTTAIDEASLYCNIEITE